MERKLPIITPSHLWVKRRGIKDLKNSKDIGEHIQEYYDMTSFMTTSGHPILHVICLFYSSPSGYYIILSLDIYMTLDYSRE